MALVGLSILSIPALALIGLWIWALVIILTTPTERWDAAALNQWMWLGVVVFLPLIGSILFLAIGRRQLMESGSGATQEQEMVR